MFVKDFKIFTSSVEDNYDKYSWHSMMIIVNEILILSLIIL